MKSALARALSLCICRGGCVAVACVVLVGVSWQLRAWRCWVFCGSCVRGVLPRAFGVLASRALSSSDLGAAGAGAVCWSVKVPTASCLRECPQWAWCFDLLAVLGVLSFLNFSGCSF